MACAQSTQRAGTRPAAVDELPRHSRRDASRARPSRLHKIHNLRNRWLGHPRACSRGLTQDPYRPLPRDPLRFIGVPSRYITRSMKYCPSESVRDSSM